MVDANLITEKIMAALAEEEEFSDILVKRDTQVEGRTASYPVDLYLDFFSDNGVHYKIIIKTKTAAKVLTKNELFSFANVLQDISGQVMGVVFTQPVYDAAVHGVARDIGIMLYELRGFAGEPLWEPEVADMKVDVDAEWARAEKAKYGLENETISAGGEPKNMFLYDGDGNCVDSIEGVFNEYIKTRYRTDDFATARIRHEFKDAAVYLATEHHLITRVKLNAVEFTLQFRQIGQLDGREIVISILRAALLARLN